MSSIKYCMSFCLILAPTGLIRISLYGCPIPELVLNPLLKIKSTFWSFDKEHHKVGICPPLQARRLRVGLNLGIKQAGTAWSYFQVVWRRPIFAQLLLMPSYSHLSSLGSLGERPGTVIQDFQYMLLSNEPLQRVLGLDHIKAKLNSKARERN